MNDTKTELLRICDAIMALYAEADALAHVVSIAGAAHANSEIHLNPDDFFELFPELSEAQAVPFSDQYMKISNGRFFALIGQKPCTE